MEPEIPEGKTITLQVLGSETFVVKPDPAELCRLCANTDNQLIPIFKGEGLEHNIPSKLEQHLPIVKITDTDRLPLQVCYQCASTLIAWHNLYEGCSVADKRLREILAVDEKLFQDEATFEDYGDDFRDDDFDQPQTDFETIRLGAIGTSSQPNQLDPSATANEITQLDSSRIFEETEQSLADERCLRWQYGSTKRFDEDVVVGANTPGTGGGHRAAARSNDDLVNAFLVQRDELPATGSLVGRASWSVCDCVWNVDEGCARCSRYDSFKCAFCPIVLLGAGIRNRHLRSSHKPQLVEHCREWFLRSITEPPPTEAAAAPENDDDNDDGGGGDDGESRYQCDKCAEAFNNKVELIGHLRGHVVRQKRRRATLEANLERHTSGWHSRRRRYQCEHCSKVVSTKEGMRKHLATAHPLNGTSAAWTANKLGSRQSVCPLGSDDAAAVAPPQNGYHTCDVCGQIFLKQQSFTRHLNQHTAGRHACDKCRQSFASEAALKAHRQRAHKELPKNVFVVNGRKYLKCEQCTFTCRNERNKLEEHLRVHTGEKPFTCEQCGKQFRTKALLRVHSRYVHEGVKEHACDLCGRRFSNKRYMEEHRRIHTGEKPLICDLCGQTFRQNSSLSKHVENHLGIKRHACSMCDRRFSNSHHLSIHVKRHLGEASHMCEHCGKKFVDQYQLKNHKVVHSEARPFVCRLCGAGFKLRKHLKQHESTHRP